MENPSAQNEGGEDQPEPLRVESVSQVAPVEQEPPVPKDLSPKENKDAQLAPNPPQKAESRIIEQFFEQHWNNFISKFKIPAIIFVLILLSFAAWRVSKFGPAPESFQQLEDAHHLTKLIDSLRNDFHTGEDDDVIKVSIIWGVDGLSRKGVGRWDSANRGKIIWDTDFDMSSTQNQQRVLDI